jgi:hypothetical protein
MLQQDEFTDDLVEPAMDAFQRYGLRQRARRARGGLADPDLAGDLGLPPAMLAAALRNRFFGGCWATLEAASRVLQRRRVRFADVAREIVAAQVLLQGLAPPETLAAD